MPLTPSLAPFAERDYRLLFAAQAVSLLGSWMTPIALAFAVLELTDSPTALGIVLGAELVPVAVLLLAGGVWADRLPRMRVMVAADVISAAGQGAMGVLLISGHAQVWLLAVLATVGGAADAFHQPAWAGLLPETVPEELLQRANALRHLESNVARVAGPVIAGILVATAGAGWAILADALSFLVAAAVLSRMAVGRRAVDAEPSGFREDFARGWSEVRSRLWLMAMVLDTGLWVLVIWGPYWVLGPIVANRELDGASSWAVISAAYGLGTVAGGAAGLRVHPRRPLLVAVVINAAFAPMLALLAVAAPTWSIALAAVPAGAAVSLYLVLWDTTVQQRVPREALARVASYERAATFALMPVGMALAGPVAARLGVAETLWISVGWLGVSTVFLLCMPSVRGLERLSSSARA